MRVVRNVFKISAFIIVITPLFFSCEKDLVISGQYEEKLVLNGLAEIDKPISIELSKSKNMLDKNDKIDWIRNADVYLTCGNNTYQEQLTYDSSGVYKSTHLAKYSESYKLEVVHPTYKEVFATGRMPDEPQAIVKYIDRVPGENKSVFNLEIKNKNEDQFYIWEMIYDNQEVEEEKNVSIVSTDNKTDNILPDVTQVQSKIFLEGSSAQTENISSSFIADDIEEEDISHTTVRLFTMNKDMYNYYRSLELYKNAQASFVEPIEIYSNVENGLGIFGAISEAVIIIEY